ncbi:Fc.00g032730.m01.CDS01 [Cosmosporella sp. VM-42]
MAPVYASEPFTLIATPASKETDPDLFSRLASEMALVHNMIIRGLNSIYLQAPHVLPTDVLPFLRYSRCWYDLLNVHHSGEEASFFPYIETTTGQKGLMETNVEQHHAFSVGVEDFKSYIDDCLANRQQFDGQKLVKIIDGFGETLTTHLGDEIPTLVNLREFGMKKMSGLEKKFGEEGEENMKKLGLAQGLPFCFSNHDVNYEGGRWASWPPAPRIVHILARHVTYWLHTDQWKFAPCDRHGKMRSLYAVSRGKA